MGICSKSEIKTEHTTPNNSFPKTRILQIGYILKFDSPPIPGKQAAAVYGLLRFISAELKHFHLLLWPLTLHFPTVLTTHSSNFNLTKISHSVDTCASYGSHREQHYFSQQHINRTEPVMKQQRVFCDRFYLLHKLFRKKNIFVPPTVNFTTGLLAICFTL